jgi:Short-chain dehydrogenases of various substrate specificities
MTDVKEKWALITGASRGVGYQIAIFMAKNGCNLVLHSRNLSHTYKLLAEVHALGVEAYAVEAELSNMDDVNRMLDKIEGKGTHIDILFNDAAVQIAYRKNYFETPVEDYTQSFMINTIAPTMICYRLLPKMIENGFGRVINTTSGIQNEPEQAGYSASKAALDKITKDLGSKLEGTDVMINLVDPGWLRTDLGGPNAPNDVKSCVPGIVVGAFLDDKKSGRFIAAQDYTGMTLEEAVQKAYSLEKDR